MSRPKIVPDMLTLLTLSFQYPHAFATPYLTAGMPYCLISLMGNDVLMRTFKAMTQHPRHEAERVILLWEDPASVLDAFPDRPGVMCACGLSVTQHPGGEHYRGAKK